MPCFCQLSQEPPDSYALSSCCPVVLLSCCLLSACAGAAEVVCVRHFLLVEKSLVSEASLSPKEQTQSS